MNGPQGPAEGDDRACIEQLESTYSAPRSAVSRYLACFRLASACEQRAFTRLNSIRSLFVSAHGLWRSRSSLSPLRRGIAPVTFLGWCSCLLVATYECSEDTPLQPALAPR